MCRLERVFAVAVLLAGAAHGQTWFEETTSLAGIAHSGLTAGVSWGDVNGDGWPDVFVGNHWPAAGRATLLINQQDGTFRDASALVPVPADSDLHGAAWADFDRDGDQDLVVLAGAGGSRHPYPNVLFENRDGHLVDVAAALGIDYAAGRSRTPVWLDTDNDGSLELLVTTMARTDGLFPTAIFRRDAGAFVAMTDLPFPPVPRTRLGELGFYLKNAWHYRMQDRFGSLLVNDVFAQLGDLSGDKRIDLIAYGHPTRVYSLEGETPEEISSDLYLGTIEAITDVAIEDFDGDLQFDLFLARVRPGAPDVVHGPPERLRAVLNRARPEGDARGIRFKSPSSLEITIIDAFDDSGDLPKVVIGAGRRSPSALTFEVDPEDPTVAGPVPHRSGDLETLVGFDASSGEWTIADWASRVHVEVRSLSAPITDVAAIGFEPTKGALTSRLLLNRDGTFEPFAFLDPENASAPCTSVAAGDFDNDMDVDVYLVCADPVENAPNVLFENHGNGRLMKVPEAGGAEGSPLGRGDAVAIADYDRDGALDLFVTNGNGSSPFSDDGPYQLFRGVRNGNHWIEIDLEGARSNVEGIGAIVEISAGGVRQTRAQAGGIHSFAQNHARLHFGLGANAQVDEIIVWWPSGIVQRLAGVAADRLLTITEADER